MIGVVGALFFLFVLGVAVVLGLGCIAVCLVSMVPSGCGLLRCARLLPLLVVGMAEVGVQLLKLLLLINLLLLLELHLLPLELQLLLDAVVSVGVYNCRPPAYGVHHLCKYVQDPRSWHD